MRFAKISEKEARAHIESQDGEDYRPEKFEVYPENWDTVMLFLRVQTQWRVDGMGGASGIDYKALACVMDMAKVQEPLQELDRIRLMESAALDVMGEVADAD